MKYKVIATEQFLTDLKHVSDWIYSTNLEQSEDFANKKLTDLETELNGLAQRIAEFSLSGVAHLTVADLRRFPIYDGRFNVQWIAI